MAAPLAFMVPGCTRKATYKVGGGIHRQGIKDYEKMMFRCRTTSGFAIANPLGLHKIKHD